MYLEEYRTLASENANTQGKLTNLNNIGSPSYHCHDFLSNASTTISTNSSIKSLTGSQANLVGNNPLVINQQHHYQMMM